MLEVRRHGFDGFAVCCVGSVGGETYRNAGPYTGDSVRCGSVWALGGLLCSLLTQGAPAAVMSEGC